MMRNSVLSLLGAFGIATGAVVFTASTTHAQSGSESAASTGVTVAELAGTWVEPETERDDGEIITRGSENIVEITPDGRFTDGLDVNFTFRSNTIFNGDYRFTSSGRVEIADGQISWIVEEASVIPVIPANASGQKRQAMSYFAKEVAKGMVETETYPIVSYDGDELVMNAGSYDDNLDYVMTRR